MSPITTPGDRDLDNQDLLLDFQSTSGLSESAAAFLEKAFASGSFEAQKLHHGSAQLRQLINEARESIAANLKVPANYLEFTGELGFGYWAAIAGSLKEFSGTFIHGSTDRQVVHAFAREFANHGNRSMTLETDRSGLFSYESALTDLDSRNERFVAFWQGTNRETGVEQRELRVSISEQSLLVADMTAAISPSRLPSEFGVALWDPRNFGGPEGLAILAINPESRWSSPIPAIDQRRLFGSYSKPLLLLTAIALEERRRKLDADLIKLKNLNAQLRKLIATEMPEVEVIGDPNEGDPRYLALVVQGVAAEEILRGLERRGILLDAGSACGSGALSPSHVLEAMGFGQDGHLRITLKPEHSGDDLKVLVRELNAEIELFRAAS